MTKGLREKWCCPKCKAYNTRFLSRRKTEKTMFCCDCGDSFNVKSVLKKTTKAERERRDERVCKAKSRRKRKFLGKRAAQMRQQPTLSEAVFQKKLKAAKFNFKAQWVYDVEGFAGIVDFYLYDYKLLIEVDGGYHTTEDQRLKDAEKDFVCGKLLNKTLVRLTDEEALEISDEGILALLDA